jgi:putative DNA primase/helicase
MTSTPPVGKSAEEIIQWLAKLSSLDYDRVRRDYAQQLKVQIKTLDDEVKEARNQASPAAKLPFPTVEPWPHPIDPASVLDETVEIIQRYVVMDSAQARAAALWIAMTWFIDVVEVAALALITAPEKACGKSQLLTIFGHLVARPLPAANSTSSFLFRAIEVWQPTVLIDEADTFIRENEELKGLVNAGHTRANAYVGRAVSVGDSYEPRLFVVWGAKAFAGIALERHLPDSTMSRGIVFVLRRKLPHERVERLRHADRRAFEEIASKLARFAKDNSYGVRDARPVLPDALSDRAQDNWEALFAIAECAGPKWVEYATNAALMLSNESAAFASRGNELLTDIKAVFDRKKVTRISTADLLVALVNDDSEAPWATYNRGKPLSPRQLGRLLEPYGIHSKTVRMGRFDTPKGFDIAQFEDAFTRYLTPPPVSDAPEETPDQ